MWLFVNRAQILSFVSWHLQVVIANLNLSWTKMLLLEGALLPYHYCHYSYCKFNSEIVHWCSKVLNLLKILWKKSQLCLVSGFGQIGGQMIDGWSKSSLKATIPYKKKQLYPTKRGTVPNTVITVQYKTLPPALTRPMHPLAAPALITSNYTVLDIRNQIRRRPHFSSQGHLGSLRVTHWVISGL